MECSVTITPTYHRDDGSVSYVADYSVNIGKTYVVEYNQIIYNKDKKTKHMTTSGIRQVPGGVRFSGITLTSQKTGYLKERKPPTNRIIIDEIIST